MDPSHRLHLLLVLSVVGSEYGALLTGQALESEKKSSIETFIPVSSALSIAHTRAGKLDDFANSS